MNFRQLSSYFKGISMMEWLETNGPPVLLALMGGIADCLTSDEHSLGSLLAGAFLACFVGYMGLLVCVENGVSSGMTGMICGFLGYTSRTILIIVKKISKRKLLQSVFGANLPTSVTDVIDDAEREVAKDKEIKKTKKGTDSE